MLIDQTDNESYIIFSSFEAYAHIKRVISADVAQLDGCYKGVREPSYIVNVMHANALFGSGILHDQESVLHLGSITNHKHVRSAVLKYLIPPEKVEFIGYFWPVSEEYALKQDAWTRKGEQYFVAAIEKPIEQEL